MPIICEDIENNPLIEKAKYSHGTKFIRAYSSPPPETPLLSNWNFKPCFLPAKFKNIAHQIEQFKVNKNDTWVISFPKCGTTWTQTMVWLLNNNLDYELESKNLLIYKFPFLEYGMMFDKSCVEQVSTSTTTTTATDTAGNNELIDFIEIVKQSLAPRHIKSHLPVSLLPTELWTVKPKIIYVSRNPKDATISFYHHYRNMHGYQGTLMDFMEAYINDFIIYTPFHQHVIEFWKMRREENILFLTYEDMQNDLLAVIKCTAKFLGHTNYTDEQLERLRDHLHFNAMRCNATANNCEVIKKLTENLGFEMPDPNFCFIRKGKTGSFLEEMPSEIIERFDDWTANELKNYDFKFKI